MTGAGRLGFPFSFTHSAPSVTLLIFRLTPVRSVQGHKEANEPDVGGGGWWGKGEWRMRNKREVFVSARKERRGKFKVMSNLLHYWDGVGQWICTEDGGKRDKIKEGREQNESVGKRKIQCEYYNG